MQDDRQGDLDDMNHPDRSINLEHNHDTEWVHHNPGHDSFAMSPDHTFAFIPSSAILFRSGNDQLRSATQISPGGPDRMLSASARLCAVCRWRFRGELKQTCSRIYHVDGRQARGGGACAASVPATYGVSYSDLVQCAS